MTEIDPDAQPFALDSAASYNGETPASESPDPPETPQDGSKQPKSVLRNIVELVLTVAAAIVLALLVQAFLFKPYTIPSGSMEPTLTIGQRIIVNRLDTSPSLGDVTVFHPPALAGGVGNECADPQQGPGTSSQQACDKSDAKVSTQTFVKRVVGLPGDHLKIINGYVYNDGKRETGTYINRSNCSTNDECTLPKEITVPKGDYYMMGDNRGNSDDSRYWGPVPQKNIIGVAIITYWPLNRIGFF